WSSVASTSCPSAYHLLSAVAASRATDTPRHRVEGEKERVDLRGSVEVGRCGTEEAGRPAQVPLAAPRGRGASARSSRGNIVHAGPRGCKRAAHSLRQRDARGRPGRRAHRAARGGATTRPETGPTTCGTRRSGKFISPWRGPPLIL